MTAKKDVELEQFAELLGAIAMELPSSTVATAVVEDARAIFKDTISRRLASGAQTPAHPTNIRNLTLQAFCAASMFAYGERAFLDAATVRMKTEHAARDKARPAREDGPRCASCQMLISQAASVTERGLRFCSWACAERHFPTRTEPYDDET